ncbi:unnamed protein product [Brassica napus]|uniref:(rape) hypothetical protein n=1 Tax=Brassica napus TaxID=3708 RepID=A0A816SIH8_BRANA|nr:unnamed protein product [Brassica napus]
MWRRPDEGAVDLWVLMGVFLFPVLCPGLMPWLRCSGLVDVVQMESQWFGCCHLEQVVQIRSQWFGCCHLEQVVQMRSFLFMKLHAVLLVIVLSSG